MYMNRRHFLLFLSTSMAATGCESVGGGKSPAILPATVNIGSSSNYTADGIYLRYRNAGFFIVRQGDKLFALSSYCTHRKCRLTSEPDRSFYCPCHGSTFDPEGHVTKGPARVDLPIFPIASNDRGELIVQAQ